MLATIQFRILSSRLLSKKAKIKTRENCLVYPQFCMDVNIGLSHQRKTKTEGAEEYQELRQIYLIKHHDMKTYGGVEV
jgi:hypothetical protein